MTKYKGFSGSIKSIDASNNHPQLLSCGVDRFAILYNLDTRQVLKKIYAKVQLNCCLLRGDNFIISTSQQTKKLRRNDIC